MVLIFVYLIRRRNITIQRNLLNVERGKVSNVLFELNISKIYLCTPIIIPITNTHTYQYTFEQIHIEGWRPLQLSGSVCVYHPAAWVQNPSTTCTLFPIYISIVMWKERKQIKKQAWIGPIFNNYTSKKPYLFRITFGVFKTKNSHLKEASERKRNVSQKRGVENKKNTGDWTGVGGNKCGAEIKKSVK